MFFSILQRNRDLSMVLLRLAVAGIFLFAGYAKWVNFDALPPLMKILAIAEPLGGVAILIGLLTRWAGLGLSIIMLGAIYTKITVMSVAYAESGKVGWGFDALILTACIMMMTIGPGRYSLDAKVGWDHA